MDFLDPRKKRAYQTRLIIGYILMAIVIGLATYILVYAAYGFGVNTKTGDVVQNGLLFIDSKPGDATIQLSGASTHQTTTAARLNLPSGDYTLKLSKAGYRDWQRSFTLEEHSIARFVYPILFPLDPVATTLHNYESPPIFSSQSPDQRWLLIQDPSTSTGKVSLDVYDTTKPNQPRQKTPLPNGLLTKPNLAGSSLSVVEWSSDNNHLLLKHRYKGGTEFIIFSREDPSSSINVNKLFGINPNSVSLRNKKIDQLYIYDKTAQTLQVGDTDKAALNPVFLRHVLAFKAYGNNLLSYITIDQNSTGKVQARIWDNGRTYLLYSFNVGSYYLLDAAQFQGHWYYIAGSNTSDRIDIFKDPLDFLKEAVPGSAAAPLLALRVGVASKVAFSNNNRFILVEAGQRIGVYDFEAQTRYQYTLKAPLTGSMRWMDGHHLIGQSGGSVFVVDYDGINQQSLVTSSLADGGFFSKDYNHLFTLASGSGHSVNLNDVDMRAGADLPRP